MNLSSQLKLAAPIIVLSASLVGCAARPTHWPIFKEDQLEVVVVVGDFGRWHTLDEMPCLMTLRDLQDGAHCYSGAPAVNSFTVKQVVFGEQVPSRFWLFSFSSNPSPPTGFKGASSLVAMLSDGSSYALPRRELLPVVRTLDGRLAIPVLDEREGMILPCAVRAEVKPLRFEERIARRPAKDFAADELAALRTNPEFRQEGADVIVHRGILLSDLKSYFKKNGANPDTILCAPTDSLSEGPSTTGNEASGV